MLHLLPKVTFFTELTTNLMEDQHKHNFISPRLPSLEFYTRNIILPTSCFKQKSYTLIKAFQEHQAYAGVTRPFRPGRLESAKGLACETRPLPSAFKTAGVSTICFQDFQECLKVSIGRVEKKNKMNYVPVLPYAISRVISSHIATIKLPLAARDILTKNNI